MADLIVIEQLQAFLVAQGVAQLPGEAASDTVPSVWVQPRDGAPAPRTLDETTITLVDSLLAPAATLEAWIEEAFVDVIVVNRLAAKAKLTHRVIRDLLHPIAAHGGRTNWQMGALLVEYSTIWIGEQPLYQGKDFYSRKASYRIGCRRHVLAGT